MKVYMFVCMLSSLWPGIDFTFLINSGVNNLRKDEFVNEESITALYWIKSIMSLTAIYVPPFTQANK